MSALLRALGLLRRVDSADFPDSFLQDGARPPTRQLPGIDGDALFAAYDRLAPGTLAEDLSAGSLGPWDDTSFHLRGDLDFAGAEAAFGVALRNGLDRPWATGTAPLAELADNSALFGTASWNGALLGVTPAAETVAGQATSPSSSAPWTPSLRSAVWSTGVWSRRRERPGPARGGATATWSTPSRSAETPSIATAETMARSSARSSAPRTRRWAACSNEAISPSASAGCGSADRFALMPAVWQRRARGPLPIGAACPGTGGCSISPS